MVDVKDSILDSLKQMVSIEKDYDVYDVDILININSIFSTLQQLGVGPTEGFSIDDSEAVWDDFLAGDKKINNVKSYMYLRLKLLFDPPPTSFALEAVKEQIKEMEWRLMVQKDPYPQNAYPEGS